MFTLDVNQYKPALVELVSEQTGREFHIDGDLELSPSLTPAITVSGISLGNAEWASGPDMVTVGRVEARISILPLLSGTVHINEFVLHDAAINLEKDASGRGNWEFPEMNAAAPTQETGQATAPLPSVNIQKVEIRNARLAYRDAQAESSSTYTIREFTTSVTELDAPLDFELLADINEMALELSGTVGAVNTLLAGEPYSVAIDGSFAGLELGLNGTIANAMNVQGANFTFNAEADSLEALSEISASELPDLSPVRLAGKLTFDTLDRITIESIMAQLGDSVINGNISVNSAGDVPGITIRLQSDLLDLTAFASEPEEQELEFLFPRDPLPLDVLASINVDMELRTGLLKLPGVELVDNRLALQLQNGRLQLDNESGLAGGQFAANIGLQPVAGNQASLAVTVSGNGIMLEQLPHEEDRWFTGGATEIAIDGGGRGQSVAEIMAAYNGNVLIKVAEATLPSSGIDMFGADILLTTFNRLNPLSDQQSAPLLECAVINLPVNDGIIKLDRQIAIQTSQMYMVVSGEINLKDESLNLGVRPYAKKGTGLNLSSVAGAAKIGGTLANPRPQFDVANALKTGASAGAAVATGGLSLLAQGLFNRAGVDPQPCNTALGIAPAETDTTDEPAEPAGGDVIDGVKNKLRGLFGN